MNENEDIKPECVASAPRPRKSPRLRMSKKPYSPLQEMLIGWVRYYQRNASPKTRSACLYTPSCSEYMILSIEKYGSFPGTWKGLKRIYRCRPPYGGEDLP